MREIGLPKPPTVLGLLRVPTPQTLAPSRLGLGRYFVLELTETTRQRQWQPNVGAVAWAVSKTNNRQEPGMSIQ